ncbi:MAG TPA: hypothetical protein VJZ27_09965 [Aggregatilineales bacterium]|nr:hypothetical protein [Aggregatilineales bacterium]
MNDFREMLSKVEWGFTTHIHHVSAFSPEKIKENLENTSDLVESAAWIGQFKIVTFGMGYLITEFVMVNENYFEADITKMQWKTVVVEAELKLWRQDTGTEVKGKVSVSSLFWLTFIPSVLLPLIFFLILALVANLTFLLCFMLLLLFFAGMSLLSASIQRFILTELVKEAIGDPSAVFG